MATILQTIFSDAFSWIKSLSILIKYCTEVFPNGQIDNDLALVKIMAWCRIGDKSISETMLARFTDAHLRHQEEMVLLGCRGYDINGGRYDVIKKQVHKHT